jgi:hypothetical protein
MAEYQLRFDGSILRRSDQALIPPDPMNTDYAEYLTWAATNTPDPATSRPLEYTDNGRLQGLVSTSDAAVTDLFRRSLPPMTGFVGILLVIGVDRGNGAMYARRGMVGVKRLSAGALMVGANLDPPITNAAQTVGWDVSGGVIENDFRVIVTGALNHTIDWRLDGTYISFTPQGR